MNKLNELQTKISQKLTTPSDAFVALSLLLVCKRAGVKDMKIKEGGSTQNIRGKKIEEIKINWTQSESYIFEMWVNDSLSYLTINELLELKTEIQKALDKAVKS